MAQSITTLLDKTAITASEIEAATNVLNYLYLVHGTGSGRSRKIELAELKAIMSHLSEVTFDKISMQKTVTGGAAELAFTGEKLSMSATPAGVTDSGTLELSRLLLQFVTNPSQNQQDSTTLNSEGLTVSGVRSSVEKVSRVKYDSVSTPHLVAVKANVTGEANFSHLCMPIIEASGNYNTQLLETRVPVIGEMVAVKNNANSSIEVIIGVNVGSSSATSNIITVNEGCSVILFCTGTYVLQDVTYHSWTPAGNYTISHHS